MKNRSSLIRSVFKAYVNLKACQSISHHMQERRDKLQKIGRDNLDTITLVKFIDWRNT